MNQKKITFKEFVEEFKDIPLTDLHNHLGATASPSVLWEIAHDQGLRMEFGRDYRKFEETIGVKGRMEHDKYLSKFKLTQEIQSSPEAIKKCVKNAIGSMYRKYNVNNLELRFNPMKRNRDKLYNLDTIIMSAIMGMQNAKLMYPVKCGLIIETDKSFTPDQSEILAEKAVMYKQLGIVGFDVSGSDKNFVVGDHVGAFRYAKDNGLGITAHTGELPNSQKEMLEILRLYEPDRIGHGIQTPFSEKYSDDIIQILINKNVVLELCPTSNYITQVLDKKRLIANTIFELYSLGINISINTDGVEFFGNSILREFYFLYENCDEFSLDKIKKMMVNSESYTFINDHYRANW